MTTPPTTEPVASTTPTSEPTSTSISPNVDPLASQFPTVADLAPGCQYFDAILWCESQAVCDANYPSFQRSDGTVVQWCQSPTTWDTTGSAPAATTTTLVATEPTTTIAMQEPAAVELPATGSSADGVVLGGSLLVLGLALVTLARRNATKARP